MLENDSNSKTSPKRLTPARLERQVLAYVARYLSSTARLQQFIERLLKRWQNRGDLIEVSEADIENLIERCTARGYVDDQRFAEVRLARWYRAGNAKRLMHQKLRAEQLDEAVISAAFQAFYASHTDAPELLEYEAAMHYARKRSIGPYRNRNRAEWRERDLGKMARRGFSYDTAHRVIDHELNEDEVYN